MTNRIEEMREWRKNNPDKIKAYNEKNKDYRAKWHQENKDRTRQRRTDAHRKWWNKKQAEFKTNNTSMYQEKDKPHIEKSWETFIVHKLRTARSHAKKDKREFNITKEQILDLLIKQDYKCAILKCPLVHKFESPATMSIDRIDNTKGYTIDNVQLTSQFANLGKRMFNQEAITSLF